MPLNIPENDDEIVKRGLADIKRELEDSNPYGKNHWLKAIAVGCLKRILDFYVHLKFAIDESFPDTAAVRLPRWAAIFGKSRLDGTVSNGFAIATGTATTDIPVSTVFSSSVGTFISTDSATISAQTINIDDLTRSGSTATAVFPGAHNLASGISVTIAGATETEYNGTFTVTVTEFDEFEFTVSGSPADEIGTSATASFTSASVPVESQSVGADQNLAQDSELTLSSPISGVDDALKVGADGLTLGSDQETDSSLRDRLLDRIQNPVAMFNVAAIREQAFNVAEVTRVFVQEVTPAIGQVTVYFMMDNRTNPIPTSGDATNVKNQILTIKPAQTADSDVIVSAPTAVSTAFTFTALAPDSTSMRTAVSANLRQFFDEQTEIGVDVTEDAYRSAIFNTVDTSTGNKITSFTLSAPSADITITTGEIGTLGTVTYP